MDSRNMHFVGEVAQKAVIEKDGAILMTRFPNDPRWDFPGGRIHTGERPAEGLRREVKEELGIDVEVGNPFFADAYPFEFDKAVRYFICFGATLLNPTQPLVLEKEEIGDARWIGKEELDSVPMFDACRRALQAYFNKEN